MSRSGFALVVGCACLALSMTGCSDAWNAGPMQYVENEALTKDVGQGQLPASRASRQGPQGTRRSVWRFAPADQGSRRVGIAGRRALPGEPTSQEGEGAEAKIYPIYEDASYTAPIKVAMSDLGDARPQDGRLCDLSQELPALPRRFGGRRRTDGAIPVSPAPRLSQGDLQVHLDAERRQAAPRRSAPDDHERPARDLDAGVRRPADRVRDRAGHRLRDVPEHAGRDRAGADRGGVDLRRERPERACRTRSSRRSPTASSTSGRWRRPRS